eukprot:m.49629 g.49629  ORF g.49629 m.49629 type:complete len:186 (-) comp13360_c0_seq1:958-1515(-)
MSLANCHRAALQWQSKLIICQRSLQTIHQLTLPQKQRFSNAEPNRDRHISVSQNDLTQTLLTKSKRLNPKDQADMARFASVLSTVTSAQMQSIWRELKRYYDPLDPDRDTVQVKRLSATERASHEQQFLNLFEKVIDDANFEVLPKGIVASDILRSFQSHSFYRYTHSCTIVAFPRTSAQSVCLV